MRHLDVYMDGVFAGEIVQADSGKSTFSYASDYRNSSASTPLSLAMPLERQQHGQRVLLPYLQGLLADSEGRRKQIGQQYGVNFNNPIALLEHVGSDAAGAIQILPHGESSSDAAARTGDVTELSNSDFAELITDLIKNKATWATRFTNGRWSLPGAQPKVALFGTARDTWAIPNDSTPTTHILKPSIEPYSDHHFNEVMTMNVARLLGLNVAEDDVIYTEAGDAVIVSQRYDRKQVEGRWARLHQEDLCQALSVDPARKYQSDGGPGVSDIAKLFRTFRPHDREDAAQQFFDALCFNLAMQGTDAHAKNYSILLSGDRSKIAPLYDLGSHAPYPMASAQTLKLSMSIDGAYRMNGVGVKQLVSAGRTLGIDEGQAHDRAVEILTSTPDAYREAADIARTKFGDDPFIGRMVDSIAHYASSRGWISESSAYGR